MKYARGLGQRNTDPEYCSAIYGPRPTHNGAAWWIAAILLPILALSVAWL